jgi:hypothetical protein
VFIDAEGFEDDILRPDLYPAWLTSTSSWKPIRHPKASPTGLIERFAATHDIKRIYPSIEKADLPEQLTGRNHLDMLLACWEWRAGPTPWLVMRPKAPVSAA